MKAKREKKRPARHRSIWQRFAIALIGIIISLAYTWIGYEATQVHLPQQGGEAVLYATQARTDFRQTLMSAIQGARESIWVAVYSFTDNQLAKALNQKAQEGIDVTVICDAKATKGLKHKLGPKVHLTERWEGSAPLMHFKMLIVDHCWLWMGSANFTPASLRTHSNLLMASYAPSLAAFIESTVTPYLSFPHTARPKDLTASPIAILDSQSVELWVLPSPSYALDRLKKALSSAQKTIRVAMFTWTRRDLADLLIDAKRRGVKVEVLLDYNSAKGTSVAIAQRLWKGGIEVRLGPSNSLLHHKFAWIDGDTLVHGSANWTASAFERNDDYFTVMHPLLSSQVQVLTDTWDTLVAGSTPFVDALP